MLDSNPAKRQKTGTSTSRTADEPAVLLLTDDADNKRKALAGGTSALTVREYVESQPTEVSSALMDLLAAVGTGPERKRGAALYAEVSRLHFRGGQGGSLTLRLSMQYLLPSVLQAGVKAGRLFQGHFNPNQYNYKEVRRSSVPSNAFLTDLSTCIGHRLVPWPRQANPPRRPREHEPLGRRRCRRRRAAARERVEGRWRRCSGFRQ